MKRFRIFLVISLFIITSCSKVDKLSSRAIEESNTGNYEGAIKIWNEILDLKKDNPTYLNNLGWVLFRNDNLQEAKATLEKAKLKCNNKQLKKSIEVNIFMVETYMNGKKLLQEKAYDKALEFFKKISSKYDTNEMEKKYLALCYEGMGKIDMAKEQWMKIIESYQSSDVQNKFFKMAKEKIPSSE